MEPADLTNRACAERLIVAAVRMCGTADELATYVTASAALSLLRELCQARGATFATRMLQGALFEDGQALAAGRGFSFQGSHFEEQAQRVADQIKNRGVQSAADVEVTYSPREARRLLSFVVRPLNFLKHADRDADETLHAGSLQPVEAILLAVSAYSVLFELSELPD